MQEPYPKLKEKPLEVLLSGQHTTAKPVCRAFFSAVLRTSIESSRIRRKLLTRYTAGFDDTTLGKGTYRLTKT